MKTLARAALAAAGIVLAMTACILLAQGAITERAYHQMGARLESIREGEGRWTSLLESNAETAGWLKVEGTPIDYPVVQPRSAERSDFYLSHDFWGNASAEGCPYLDPRSDAGSRHLLVYAHRLGMTERMFSSISRAWRQESFSSLGRASWSSPDQEEMTFAPVCALKVDRDFDDIQRFAFEGEGELRTWLKDIARTADAQSPDLSAIIERTERVITLVTCAGELRGGRARTLVIFASDAPWG